MDKVERRIGTLVDKYSPTIAAQLRDARHRLRAHFPRGVEKVFDNYNALVFGIGPTDQSRDSFISIAGDPAALPRRDALAAAPPLATVIKMEVEKQRPRRPGSPKA